MQCPPTPGPGVNFMNPNGLVAAASMISQTSRPIRSHRSASWLTKAMLMFRKTFSSSFAISAASGDESSTTVSLMLASSAAARAVAAGVEPPTRRGTSLPELAGIARVDALGGEGKVEVLAGPEARVTLEDRPEGARRCAREGGRLENDQVPRAEAGADELGRRADRPEVGVTGGRDRRRHADEDGVGAPDHLGIGRHGPEPGREGRGQAFVADVLDRRVAVVQLHDPQLAAVDARDPDARLGEPEGERKPDVAEADDRDGPILFHDASLA